eukprot:CAMPEP_0172407060 /NCGR_PEP_ID=MMETSP1061-20121228/73114_1 /TAXON_ID=37318 /ORGANISM="Pseudo-nitzschia pungens, Strain cf. pungens" /LENGTH=77 /DNA_ID=CAMNT_0013142935 /DNA_START=42 /DNA_END=272 /DNA_ORIENTATION=-
MSPSSHPSVIPSTIPTEDSGFRDIVFQGGARNRQPPSKETPLADGAASSAQYNISFDDNVSSLRNAVQKTSKQLPPH